VDALRWRGPTDTFEEVASRLRAAVLIERAARLVAGQEGAGA
jgi:hypothetical protein